MSVLKRDIQHLQLAKIEISPNNPRGLTPEQLTGADRFKVLQKSIKTYGVLEPLIVRSHPERSGQFILVDGERRFWAAKQAELKKVPALIAKDAIDADMLAYQIHTLRENWSKAAEVKAIKGLITDIRKKEPNISDSDVARRIREITAHKSHEMSDLMKLAKYKDEIIEKVISRRLDMSYLVQIESNFVNPLKKGYSSLVDEYGEEEIREILILKALGRKLVNTRYLMDKFKVVFKDTEQSAKIEPILRQFLDKKTMSIENALSIYHRQVAPDKKRGKEKKDKRRKTAKRRKKPSDTSKTNFEYKSLRVTKRVQTKIEAIRPQFEEVAGCFSDDETEYISEALYCLERNCLKAATLMIWCAGISKTLDYVAQDIPVYIKAAQEMVKNRKSVYVNIARGFRTTGNSIQDISETHRDPQLLSYLYFRQINNAANTEQLLGDHKTRNNCAHPTSIDLSANTVVAVFEHVYKFILMNEKFS